MDVKMKRHQLGVMVPLVNLAFTGATIFGVAMSPGFYEGAQPRSFFRWFANMLQIT